MKASNYNSIASQLADKEKAEKLIATLGSMHDQPNARVFIAPAQENLNRINQVLTSNFAMMEASCSRLEQSLANATKVVNEKRSFEAGIRNQIKQTEKTLKETISKNQELDLKISASENKFSTLTQEKQTIISDKLSLIGSMNDQQKYFVLIKAKANQDITIEGLIINAGFNEQEYLAAQQQEQTDELEDIFAEQLNVNQESEEFVEVICEDLN
jgi:hypothetical protein